MTWTARVESVVPASVAFLVVIGAWWALTVVGDLPAFFLPPPDAVVGRLTGNPGLYLRNALFTLEKVVGGGAIGVVGGFVLAIAITYVSLLRKILLPYLVTIRVLPKIAIAPLLLIYMGTGMETAIVFVALIAFFPMVLNAAAGFERAPRTHRDLLRSVDAPPLKTFAHVTLPYALPDIFAGLKQSVTLAVVGAIVAEWIVADSGLGYLVLIGSENLQTDMMIAALFAMLALGLVLYGSVVLLQQWIRRAGFEMRH